MPGSRRPRRQTLAVPRLCRGERQQAAAVLAREAPGARLPRLRAEGTVRWFYRRKVVQGVVRP